MLMNVYICILLNLLEMFCGDEWVYDKYFANAIIDEETGKLLEYRDLLKM